MKTVEIKLRPQGGPLLTAGEYVLPLDQKARREESWRSLAMKKGYHARRLTSLGGLESTGWSLTTMDRNHLPTLVLRTDTELNTFLNR